ncbi:hypothetical protein SARC_07973 [Sphaeroforma arctica JP610]|uniref:DNA-directed RNA polymerase I, II, and III subunit RPABC1 n=1 Tax=Sphaeroforma arctica JP610 TaxID=667725 RepID=A0A0L0FS67_9EUKA|nr:hypothetical protein SARC_07973 [Sphaeroforma arctica JP610]KNC79637.1 hypothetical protein SARC_07973 [Sphaeroforma arctica JP610]|eukprot:XP_014153539.1 hypothetical protein SARC_07973 [Sphaeroforma arctica JP610]
MCSDRGYSVDVRDLEMSIVDFEVRFGSDPDPLQMGTTFTKVLPDGEEDSVLVSFCGVKVGIAQVKDIAEAMEAARVKRAIFISRLPMTPSAKTGIEKIKMTGRMIEAFRETELLYNIVQHAAVPKHVVLTNAQKQEIKKKYKIVDTAFPRLLMRDPVARYYGCTRGQVLKIIRDSPMAGKQVTYRIIS